MNFKVGDRVIYTQDEDLGYATVISLDCSDKTHQGYNDGKHIAIFFENDVGGHTCNGRCEDGHGFYASKELCEKIFEPPTPEEIIAFLMVTKEVEE